MTVSRVRYRERQTLRHSDLTDEQAYLVAMRRRHAIAHHRGGIISGLKLTVQDGEIFIDPGMAVDRYGRELIVPNTHVIPRSILEQRFPGWKAIGVSLVYGRVAETTLQRGHWECGSGQENRWREVALVRLSRYGEAASPGGAAQAVSDRDPSVALGDDPERERPVFLGKITRSDSRPMIDPAGRRFIDLVGESVIAPSGRGSVQVGSEVGSDRFAVGIRGAEGVLVDRLAIDRAGRTTFRGHVTVAGNVSLDKGEKATREASGGDLCDPCWHLWRGAARSEPSTSGMSLIPLATAPAAAAPWQIYRTSAAVAGRPVNRLHVEIGHPGKKGDPSRYRLAIGRRNNGQFEPCLVVGADGTVTVPGTLIVKGQVIPAPIRPDPDDPRFAQEMLTRWLGGLTSAADSVHAVYNTKLEVTVQELSGVVGQPFSYTLRVENTGDTPITNLKLFQSIALDGQPVTTVPTVLDLPGITILEAGQHKEKIPIKLEHFTPTSDQGEKRIRLVATVLGVGPAFNVVSANGRGEVLVENKPVGPF